MSDAKQELIAQWLEYTADDIAQIRNNLEGPEYRGRMVAFHAQQASEKLLKTLIIHAGIHPQHTHDLKKLEAMLKTDHPMLPLLKKIWRFDQLNVLSRYPSEDSNWLPPSPHEAKAWFTDLSDLLKSVTEFVLTSH